MIQEYRCERCNHLLFKGSLKMLLLKRHDTSANDIEPQCPKCDCENRFTDDSGRIVVKHS